MASRQLNLRFDERHHDVVRRVVDRLRRDSSFLDLLEKLLASDSAPVDDRHAPETLERIGRLEQRLDALEPRVDILEADRPAPQSRPARAPARQPARAPAVDAGSASAEAGERTRGKPLAPAIRAEVVRLIQAGGDNTEIGRAVGVNRETVRRIRNELPADFPST
jgi:hypothetical protein